LAEPIDEHFITTVSAIRGSAVERSHDDALRDGSSLTAGECLALFDAQLGSRHLDLAGDQIESSLVGIALFEQYPPGAQVVNMCLARKRMQVLSL